jgi:hypothetical protein
MLWIIEQSPDDVNLALALVQNERDPGARQPMLQALTTAARQPPLAATVANFMVALTAGPAPPEPRDADRQPAAGGDLAGRTVDPDQTSRGELTARLSAAEAALMTLLTAEGESFSDRALFNRIATDARTLEGPSRVEWLGRVGVLAARRGNFLLARQLADELGDPARRLNIYIATVGTRAAERHPHVRERIISELLPQVSGNSF